MAEFYNAGTVSATNGSAIVTAEGAAVWLPTNIKAGDAFFVGGTFNVVHADPVYDSGEDEYTLELGYPYQGETGTGLGYTAVKTSSEWGTNRTLALQTAELIQLFAVGVITEAQLNAAVAAAEAAQTAAEAAASQIDQLYLGAKAADPATNNQGGALVAGQIYFNTATLLLRLYSGAAWANMLIGQTGLQGVGSGLQFTAVTATTDVDPAGPGNFRFNNTDHAAATKLWLDNTDLNNVSVSAVIDTWDDGSSAVRGQLYIWNRTNRAIFRIYNVSGAVVDKTGYREVTVAHVASAGVLANATQCELVFIPKGDKGDTGNPATVAVGTVTPLPSGSAPTVVNAGTSAAAVLNFGLPVPDDGEPGDDGADGTDPGILLIWDEDNADIDQGAGKIWSSHDALGSATTIYVSKTNRASDDISTFLATIDDSSNPSRKGSLVLTRSGGNAQATFDVTALVDATGYVKLTVINPSGAGGFLTNDLISLQFTPAGDQGASGSGSGDVVGPGTSVAHRIAGFSDTSGTALEDTGKLVSDFVERASNGSDFANKQTTLDNLSLQGGDIASAATLNLETATGSFVDVTGTTATTAIVLADGHRRRVRAAAAWPIMVDVNLVLNNGGASYICAAGDIIDFVADGTVIRGTVHPVSGVMPAAAPLSSPAFTNNPTAPNQAAGDNSTRLANTAHVRAATAVANHKLFGGL